MDDQERIRKELYGATCTLGYWDRYLTDLITRRLRHGTAIDAAELAKIDRNRAYWRAKVDRLQQWLDERPPGWGSF